MSRSAAATKTLLATLMLGLSALPAMAETAFSESYGQLFAIDPDAGIFRVVGSTGTTDGLDVLAFGPDGELLGVSLAPADPTLYALDPRTGAATLVGAMMLEGPSQVVRGLAADSLGRWWVSVEDRLYSLDPATAQATLAVTLDHSVDALAAFRDQLYAVSNTASALVVERVEPDTGQLEIVVQAEPIGEAITDAAFDSMGDLRFLTIGGGILAVIPHGFYRVDLDTGAVEQTYFESPFFTEPQALISGLALGERVEVVSIPTLGPWSAGLLVLLLVSAAFWALARGGSRA